MKKSTVFLLIFFGVFSFQGKIWAEEPDAFVKLGRGLTNIITAPGEFFMQPVNLRKNHDPFTAFFGGLFKGMTFMVLREVAGVYEVVTFPIPFPARYQPLWQTDLFPATVPAAMKREFGEH